MNQIIKPLLIILVMLLLTIGVGGAAGFAFARSGQNRVNLVAFSVPNVEATMRSSSDGRRYHVNLDLYLELNSEIVDGLSVYVARKQLQRNLENLDYDIVAADGGMDYVTEQITSWFAEDIRRDRDVGNVYVSNMVTGQHRFYPIDAGEADTEDDKMSPERLRTFNALFRAAQ
jgi:hypothetical protein